MFMRQGGNKVARFWTVNFRRLNEYIRTPLKISDPEMGPCFNMCTQQLRHTLAIILKILIRVLVINRCPVSS
jgi:hypothetical protein